MTDRIIVLFVVLTLWGILKRITNAILKRIIKIIIFLVLLVFILDYLEVPFATNLVSSFS